MAGAELNGRVGAATGAVATWGAASTGAETAIAARRTGRESTKASRGTTVEPCIWLTLTRRLSTVRQACDGGVLMLKLLMLRLCRSWCA